MSTKRIPRCSFAAGQPNQCTGVAKWVTMNSPGNPTRMIWCDDCHARLEEVRKHTGSKRHARLTSKLAAMMDRPWNWFPAKEGGAK